jgi:hypothetical protein
MITGFFDQYQFHKMSREVSARLLNSHIRRRNANGSLLRWNVVIRGVTAKEQSNYESIKLGGIDAPLLIRTRRTNPVEYANIGVLMSDGDTGADLPVDRSAYKGMKAHEIRQLRQQYGETQNRGLLVLYLISKDSQPGKSSVKTKRPLEAADHLIGLGIVFPPPSLDADNESESDVEYVEVNPEYLEGYIEPDFLEEDENET